MSLSPTNSGQDDQESSFPVALPEPWSCWVGPARVLCRAWASQCGLEDDAGSSRYWPQDLQNWNWQREIWRLLLTFRGLDTAKPNQNDLLDLKKTMVVDRFMVALSSKPLKNQSQAQQELLCSNNSTSSYRTGCHCHRGSIWRYASVCTSAALSSVRLTQQTTFIKSITCFLQIF